MRSIEESFYKSKAWKDCRAAFVASRISADGGLCQCCHMNPGYIVHHKEHLSLSNYQDQSISLCHDNLEYLCIECHNSIHMGRKMLLCGFDSHGRPIDAATIFGNKT